MGRGTANELYGFARGFIANFIGHTNGFLSVEQPAFGHGLVGVTGLFVYLIVGNTALQSLEPLVEEVGKRGSKTFFVGVENVVPGGVEIEP